MHLLISGGLGPFFLFLVLGDLDVEAALQREFLSSVFLAVRDRQRLVFRQQLELLYLCLARVHVVFNRERLAPRRQLVVRIHAHFGLLLLLPLIEVIFDLVEAVLHFLAVAHVLVGGAEIRGVQTKRLLLELDQFVLLLVKFLAEGL